MIYNVLKNTFSALVIVWALFLTGFIISDAPGEGFRAVFYFQQLKILISYTVFGLVIGGLSAGILARRKRKYAFYFENNIKKYSIYFLKGFSISFLAIFAVVSRELINNPLLFERTLLSGSFWFSGIFVFMRDKFSPMYFTVFFIIILSMSIHNLVTNLSLYHGGRRIAGYSVALVFSLLLVFNFGYLSANTRPETKNIIFIAVEGLKNYHLSRSNLRENKAIASLKQNSYLFENFYTPVKDPRTALLVSLSAVHPEKDGFLRGYASHGLKDKTILSFLKKKGYNTGIYTDSGFAYKDFEKGHKHYVGFPDNKDKIRSEALLSHLIMPSIFSNKLTIPLFPESKFLTEYRDGSLIKNSISEIIKDKSAPFAFLLVIPDYSDLLPYPFYHLAESRSVSEANLSFINDEIDTILRMLKKRDRADDTVICLYGLPETGSGLRAVDYKIPFVLSYTGYEMERKVRNDYSIQDIFPTSLDAAGVEYSANEVDGVSFFAPEFVRQQILLTDVTPVRSRADIYFSNINGLLSKKMTAEREMYPLISRSLISGDYKLNIIPSPKGPAYEMFDISKDPEEIDDISGSNPATLRRMRSIFEDKMNREFNFKIINGYVLK